MARTERQGTSFFKNLSALYLIQGAILLLLPFGLYWGGVDFSYILDDKIVISENSYVKKGIDGIGEILSTDSFRGYFGEQRDLVEGGRYRPLSLVTFAIEYEIWKLNPRISHIGNIFLYSISGVLVMILGIILNQKLFIDKYNIPSWLNLGFVAGLLFITHPIHTEVVANIKGRDEILALLLSLAALLFVAQSIKKRTILYSVLSGVFIFLACMSKENAITMLAVVPMFIYFLDRKSSRALLLNTASVLLAIGAYLIIRHNVIGYTISSVEITNPMNNSFYGMNAMEHWSTIFYTLWRYVELLVFPHPLSHDYYPYAVPNADLSYIRPWLGIIAYIAMAIFAIYRAIKKPNLWSFGILFYLFTLSIVSNVFFSIGTFMNERFIYMPSVGFVLILAGLIVWLSRKSLLLSAALAGLIAIGYSVKTVLRVPVWENNITLNTAAVNVSENSARANLFMGTALYRESLNAPDKQEEIRILQEAAPYIDRAISIWGEEGNSVTKYFAYSEAFRMKAGVSGALHSKNALSTRNLLDIFEYLLRRKPDIKYIQDYMKYLNKRESPAALLPFYHKVGGQYIPHFANRINTQYYSIAIDYLNMALTLDPKNPKTLNLLADVYEKAGNNQQSNVYRRKAQNLKTSGAN